LSAAARCAAGLTAISSWNRGLGVAVIPAFAFTSEIASGRVKVLLKDLEPMSLPTHAVYPSRRFVPLKVRAMIDHLAHEFSIDPALSDYGSKSQGDSVWA
jgi:DNA-binding transcriptional LysR family regulator